MISVSLTDKKMIAAATASMLLEIEAVHVNAEKPFILTSGAASPVYIDCRKLISFPRIRAALMDFGISVLSQEAGSFKANVWPFMWHAAKAAWPKTFTSLGQR